MITQHCSSNCFKFVLKEETIDEKEKIVLSMENQRFVLNY